MKRCPQCKRTYDESLSFCLEDGTVLSAAHDPQETLLMSRPEVLPLPRTIASPESPARHSANRRLLYALILLLAILGAGVTVALFYERDRPLPASSDKQAASSSANKNTTTKSLAQTPQQPAQDRSEISSSHNLTGEWNLINTIENSSYLPYINSRVGFRLSIIQVGQEITAEGKKVSANGKDLSFAEQSPIHLTGRVDGTTIVATFVEEGLRRNTHGKFIWQTDYERGKLNGRFTSTAANSSGSSIATKER